MRKFIIAAGILAVAAPVAPSLAQSRQSTHDYRGDVRWAEREYRDDMRKADSPRERREARREYQRNLRQANRGNRQANRDWRGYRNYDWNRREPGTEQYYADRYYRDGNYYQTRTLAQNDRIYRGQNGQYYCRRPDGTTGLIIGGLVGGFVGNRIMQGESETIGTIIGAAGGAIAGRAIERGGVRCR